MLANATIKSTIKSTNVLLYQYTHTIPLVPPSPLPSSSRRISPSAPAAAADTVQYVTAAGIEAAAGEADAGDAAAQEEEEHNSYDQPNPPIKTTFSIQNCKKRG